MKFSDLPCYETCVQLRGTPSSSSLWKAAAKSLANASLSAAYKSTHWRNEVSVRSAWCKKIGNQQKYHTITISIRAAEPDTFLKHRDVFQVFVPTHWYQQVLTPTQWFQLVSTPTQQYQQVLTLTRWCHVQWGTVMEYEAARTVQDSNIS